MDPAIRIYKRPRLKNPSLVIGWADAGLVGIRAVDYLTEELGATEFAEIEPHDFALLPNSIVKNGVLQEIEYPANSFYYWKNQKAEEDLIMLGSRPPALHHYEFANLVLDVAELFKVKRIYTVGGIYANVAHSARPRVMAVINSSRLKNLVANYGVELSLNYHGPTSMNGLTIGLARYRSIEGISLWGQVPTYIGDLPNPRVCRAVLRILTRMLKITIDFSGIEAEARRANKQIEELVSYIRQQNPDLDQHINNLEKGIGTESVEEDNLSFFQDIEEFLRKQKGRREND